MGNKDFDPVLIGGLNYLNDNYSPYNSDEYRDVNIICSIKSARLNLDDYGEFVVKTFLYRGYIDFGSVRNFIVNANVDLIDSENNSFYEYHIYVISFFREEKDDVRKFDIVGKNVVVFVHYISIVDFFDNINSYFVYDENYKRVRNRVFMIWIFQGLKWSDIVMLFRLYNYNISGGSITRRHILSSVDLILVYFLTYVLCLSINGESIDKSWCDDLLIKKKFDSELLDYLENRKKSDCKVRLFEVNDSFLKNFFRVLFLKNCIVLYNDKITDLKKEKNKLSNLNESVDVNGVELNGYYDKISNNIVRLVDNINVIKDILLYYDVNYDMRYFLVLDDFSNKERFGKLCLILLAKSKFDNKIYEIRYNSIGSVKSIYIFNSKPDDNEVGLSLSAYINDKGSDKDKGKYKDNNNENNKYKGVFDRFSNIIDNVNLRGKRKFSTYCRVYNKGVELSSDLNKYSIGNVNVDNDKYRNYDIEYNLDLKKINEYDKNKALLLDGKGLYQDSILFVEAKSILISNNSKEDKQLLLEKFLLDQGIKLRDVLLKKEGDVNYNLLQWSPKLIIILKDVIESLEKSIDNIIEENKANWIISESGRKVRKHQVILELFSIVDKKTVINILIGRFLRIISNYGLDNSNTNLTLLSSDIGEDLINSVCFNKYQEYLKGGNIELDKELTSKEKRREVSYSVWLLSEGKKYKDIYDDVTVKFTLGNRFLNLLIMFKLVEISSQKKFKESTRLIPSKKIIKTLPKKGGSFVFYDLPLKLPMLVKPKLYERVLEKDGKIVEKLGGYLLNDVELYTSLIIKKWSLKNVSSISDDNVIYDVINRISSVGYKINKKVLDFIINNGDKYDLILNPSKVPTFFDKIKKTKKESKELESFLSRRQLEMNILGLASLYYDIDEFFIPVRIDNRGRLYCYSDYLNYQGIELAKALLSFSKFSKIKKSDKRSIDFLKIYGANCYGNKLEKKSFDERIKWVNDNEFDIINFDNGKLLRKAEDKLLFIAFCFEFKSYKMWLENSSTDYFLSDFPIQLDASCNGYQHLALLMGDESLIKELNLTESSWIDKPNDFYGYISWLVQDHISKKIDNINLLNKKESLSEEEKIEVSMLDNYLRLEKLNVERKLIKKPVMTKVYNVTMPSMINYIKEEFDYVDDSNTKETWYFSKNEPNLKLKGNDIILLAKCLSIVLYNKIPQLNLFNDYLKKIAKICVLLNISIVWLLPTGLIVNQEYIESKTTRIKPFTYRGNSIALNIPDFSTINKKKQIRALMPNLVHSLDAASMALLAHSFFNNDSIKDKSFYSVHDCFATTANYINEIISGLKYTYTSLYYTENYILSFDKGIINYIKTQYGENCFNDKTKKIIVNDSIIDYPDINTIINGGNVKMNKYEKKKIFESLNKSSYIID